MFARATQDIFHQFHSLSLPKNHVATMKIFHLVQLSTWIYNEEDYNNVVEVLINKGIEDLSEHQYFNRNYWHTRIRRGTPPPGVHAQNLLKVRISLEGDQNFKLVMKEIKDIVTNSGVVYWV